VGYEAKRGDKVEVVSVRFAPEETAPEPPRGWLPAFDTPDLMHLAETSLLGAIALTALLVIFRPMVSRLTLAPSAAGSALTASIDGRMPMLGGAPPGVGLPSPGNYTALPAPATALLTDESMVNLAHVEGQMRASSIRRVAELVEQHPEETLTIVRTWLAEGDAA
jgi:flagellar M-ring protein FliF